MTVRQRAKNIVKKASLYSGAIRLAQQLAPPSVAILSYHSVQDRPELFGESIGVDSIHSSSIFELQMELLARRFHPVSMDDILLFLRGEKHLPQRAVALTFDDGYKDNFQIAAPILNRFGIQATFYVTVDPVDRSRVPWFCLLRHSFQMTRRRHWIKPAMDRDANHLIYDLSTPENRETAFLSACDFCAGLSATAREAAVGKIATDLDSEPIPNESDLMMNWSEVRRLVKSGHIVGAHTMTHPNLAHISPEEAWSEMANSKYKLEKEIGVPLLHFSYPHPALYPQWSETTLRTAEKLGFATAVTTRRGAVRAGAHPLALPRNCSPRQKVDFLWGLERVFLLPSSAQGGPGHGGEIRATGH